MGRDLPILDVSGLTTAARQFIDLDVIGKVSVVVMGAMGALLQTPFACGQGSGLATSPRHTDSIWQHGGTVRISPVP